MTILKDQPSLPLAATGSELNPLFCFPNRHLLSWYRRVMFEKLCEAAGIEVLVCIIMEGVIYEKFVEERGTEVLLSLLEVVLFWKYGKVIPI